jgi:hypothetical protein
VRSHKQANGSFLSTIRTATTIIRLRDIPIGYNTTDLETALNEFFNSDNTVLIEIQLAKDSVKLFVGLALFRLPVFTSHELVNCRYDFPEFAPAYAAIPIYVVQLECPPELFIDATT